MAEPPRRLPPTAQERGGIVTEDMVAGTGRGGTRTARPIRHEESGIIPGSDMGGNLPPMAFAHDYYAEVTGGIVNQDGPLTLAGTLSADDAGNCSIEIAVPYAAIGQTLTSLVLTPRYSGPSGPVGDATNWLDGPTDPTTWSATASQPTGLNMAAASQAMPHAITPSIILTATVYNQPVTSETILISMYCPTSIGFQPDFINDGGDYTMWIDVAYLSGDGAPTEFATTHLPCLFSEDVEVNGLRVRRGVAWGRENGEALVRLWNPAAFYIGPSPWGVSIHYAYYVDPVP